MTFEPLALAERPPASAAEAAPDATLLTKFIESRDDGAFAALMNRHGPMVYGVCRRALRNSQDAEDAFQATFLVLVRKASSVQPRDRVGNWLYGVARQTAVRARSLVAKRGGREKQVAIMPDPLASAFAPLDDLHELLDRELSRLPDKYRSAIVLCDLEGKTRDEAARRLNWPEGSVASRLARGRALLAKRLARFAPALTVGAVSVALSENLASANVPTALAESTLQAAYATAAGQTLAAGLVSAQAAALTEGVMKTMYLAKLKLAALVAIATLAVGGLGAIGVSTLSAGNVPEVAVQAEPQAPAGPPAAQPAPPVDPPRKADEKPAVADPMYPDGQRHDFGVVFGGKTVTHKFHIVNTTGKPLDLSDVRVSCGCVTGTLDVKTLQPGEFATLEIILDTRRFVGPKIVHLYVVLQGPNFESEVRFVIAADSQAAPKE